MRPPESGTSRASPIATLIEKEPLNISFWEELLAKVKGQNDPLSIKTLEVVLDGLREIKKLQESAEQSGAAPLRLSLPSQSMFVRLAKAYNSPTLLREVGLIYLRELHLPEVALQHFERSIRLGGPEKELRPLTAAAAAAAVQTRPAPGSSHEVYPGIPSAEPMSPMVPNGLNKTGKLLLPRLYPNHQRAVDGTSGDAGGGAG